MDDLSKLTFPVISEIPRPSIGLSDMLVSSVSDSLSRAGPGVQLKFLMTGLLNGISSHISVVRMCPPLTNKNWDIYEPILALGSFVCLCFALYHTVVNICLCFKLF